jgi:DNA-binding MarR family transcriptional regulator
VADGFKRTSRLGLLLHEVSRLRQVLLERALKPFGFTFSQWSILVSLLQRHGMTQTELAAELGQTKAAVGELLRKMETAGVISRRSDKSDARVRRIYLTAGARMRMNRVYAYFNKIVKETLGKDAQHKIDMLCRVLEDVQQTSIQILEAERKTAALKRAAGKRSR